VILVCDPKRKPQARGAEGELAAAAAAHEAALLEARHAAEAAAGAAATARAEAGALRAGAGAEREQALAALQARRFLVAGPCNFILGVLGFLTCSHARCRKDGPGCTGCDAGPAPRAGEPRERADGGARAGRGRGWPGS
jgi:hypothetical protein